MLLAAIYDKRGKQNYFPYVSYYSKDTEQIES